MRDTSNMGLGNYELWSISQLEFLRANYATMGSKDVAKEVGRELQSVYGMASKLGLKKVPYRVGEVILLLSESDIAAYRAQEISIVNLAKRLKTSDITLSKAFRMLGVEISSTRDVALRYLPKATTAHRESIKAGTFQKKKSATAQGITLEDWKEFRSDWACRTHNDPRWKMWRCHVYRRDEYTCQMCLQKPDRKNRNWLEPHHIVKKSVRHDLMFDVDNGISLCNRCHRSLNFKEELFAPQFHAYIAKLKEKVA